MGRDLTQAQKTFLQEYIKTSNAYKSFLVAYPKSKKWKRSSVDCEASKLLDHPMIVQRLEEYNNKIESTLAKSTILNKRKILNEIIELQQACKQDGNGQNATQLQALKLLSQIAGLLQENKTEINVQTNIAMQDVSNYLDL